METKRFEYQTFGAVNCDAPCCGRVIRGATVELRQLNDAERAVSSLYYCACCAPEAVPC